MRSYEVKFRKTVMCIVTIGAKSSEDALAVFTGGDWEGDQEIDLIDTEVVSVKEEK
jgi:hypothetical protein